MRSGKYPLHSAPLLSFFSASPPPFSTSPAACLPHSPSPPHLPPSFSGSTPPFSASPAALLRRFTAQFTNDRPWSTQGAQFVAANPDLATCLLCAVMLPSPGDEATGSSTKWFMWGPRAAGIKRAIGSCFEALPYRALKVCHCACLCWSAISLHCIRSTPKCYILDNVLCTHLKNTFSNYMLV